VQEEQKQTYYGLSESGMMEIPHLVDLDLRICAEFGE
jgi:hypothetical protein